MSICDCPVTTPALPCQVGPSAVEYKVRCCNPVSQEPRRSSLHSADGVWDYQQATCRVQQDAGKHMKGGDHAFLL